MISASAEDTLRPPRPPARLSPDRALHASALLLRRAAAAAGRLLRLAFWPAGAAIALLLLTSPTLSPVLLLCMVALLVAPVRIHRAIGPWAAHLGWITAGIAWLLLAGQCVASYFNGPQSHLPAWLVDAAAGSVVATIYLAQCTPLGARWRAEPAKTRRFPAGLAIGFLVIAVATAFEAHAAAGSDKADGSGQYVSVFLWLAVAYVYAVAALTRNDLLRFITGCPSYPSAMRRVGERLADRGCTIRAWVAAGVVLWALGVQQLIAGGRDLTPAEQHLLFAIYFLAPYVLMLFPVIGCARALAADRCAGGVTDTARRRALLGAMGPWLLFFLFVAALVIGNLTMWLDALGAGPTATLMALLGPKIGALALVLCVTIVAHYGLAVELPYWWGQRTWKAAEVARTRRERDGAERALAERLGPLPTAQDGIDPPAPEMLAIVHARYTLAQEKARSATEIPTSTVTSRWDAAKKLGGISALAEVAVVIVSKGGSNGEMGVIQSLLGVLK